MPARGRFLLFGFLAASATGLVVPVARPASSPTTAKEKSNPPSPTDDLRTVAEAAEGHGEWEAAFSLYCRLLLDDRSRAVRDKVTACLRRAQQARRHKDPTFLQFVEKLSPSDSLSLYSELLGKLPSLYADRDSAAVQRLWQHGVEEFDRALGSPEFRRNWLDGSNSRRIDDFRSSLRGFWAKRPVGSAREARSQLRLLTAAAADTFAIRSPSSIALEFVCGACAGLDDYTVFLTPAQSTLDPAHDLPDLSAYGLYASFRDGGLWIDGVVSNSWASFHAPIRKHDRILRVNGRSFAPGGREALADALRSPTDGFHELEIAGMAQDAQIQVRLPVAVPTVYGVAMLAGKDGVAYARVGAFRETTARELDAWLASLKGQGMRSLILDLRGNHGGLFGSGVQVTQRFLPAGIIVTTQGQLGEYANRVFSSDSGTLAWDVPLVLLVDGETASAAEVVAGALKDHGRATLVGLSTFGKGSVQYPVKLMALDDVDDAGRTQPRSGTVRVTIARFVSPQGTRINGQGIVPHLLEAHAQRQLELAIEKAFELLPALPLSVPVP